MKKIIIIALASVCLLCAGCGAKEHGRVPLEEMSEYILEQAKDGGCVVFEDGDVSAGQEIWEAFVSDCAEGKSTGVRLYSYYVRYLLAHDESVTWEKFFRGAVSSQRGDWIDADNVYTDLIY